MRYKESMLQTIEQAKNLAESSKAGMDKKAITPKILYENLGHIYDLLDKLETQVNKE